MLALLLVPSIVSMESNNYPVSTCSYSVMDTVSLYLPFEVHVHIAHL